jgi:hypothetical protein
MRSSDPMKKDCMDLLKVVSGCGRITNVKISRDRKSIMGNGLKKVPGSKKWVAAGSFKCVIEGLRIPFVAPK